MAYKIIENLLTPNPYSRPQYKLKEIKGIVIHWVANPLTSAKNNRDYFESRKGGLKEFGSAHEVIDLDGDVIICIPKNELAYHVGSSIPYTSGSNQIYTPVAWERLNTNLPRHVKPYPNNCTYGIECCHVDWAGKMTDATYNSLVERCVDLCIEFNLKPLENLWLHQEVVGWKDCHRWFVNHQDEWEKFKQKVNELYNQKIKSEVVKKVMESFSKHFKDINKEWMAQAVDNCFERKIVSGKSEGIYEPDSSITRGEIAVVIDRTIDYIMSQINKN